MPSILPVLRTRRDRRIAKQRISSNRTRGTLFSLGILLSLFLAAFIIIGAYAYADITQDLPSIDILPRLLNPPDGLLLQPTRIYDRTGAELIFTFSPTDDSRTRRYIPINAKNPQHIPATLIDAAAAVADPQFWSHPGFTVQGYNDPDSHPTIAQKLVNELIIYNEAPTFRRAIRERILAAQITARFGRAQVMEWYLNSANFGSYAFGVDAASQFYFSKSPEELTLVESAILAATSETPALNPLDAPQQALERGRDLILTLKLSNTEMIAALAETPTFESAPRSHPKLPRLSSTWSCPNSIRKSRASGLSAAGLTSLPRSIMTYRSKPRVQRKYTQPAWPD
ncbi:transglycosylase domain-containing protein [Candidatus Villigracilis saccharophilus]|uniref:transglycosylase domain-containing protein n=1 Tax=Candidatus Villigracilis saccharophilus TaxID=3140684 RepID=UPI0031349985|nr:transglycosylase domain-containing protein [Anaerolineales bacterium]